MLILHRIKPKTVLMDIPYLAIATLIAGFFIGYYLSSESNKKRGRLAKFKHGRQYIYCAHGIIDGKKILCCTKGFSAKEYLFEHPTDLDITKLQSGQPYVYYRDKNGKVSFVSYIEYCNLKEAKA